MIDAMINKKFLDSQRNANGLQRCINNDRGKAVYDSNCCTQKLKAWHRKGCYTEKAPNAWHRGGTQTTGDTYNQRNRPSTGTPHRLSTKHYRKGSPGDA